MTIKLTVKMNTIFTKDAFNVNVAENIINFNKNLSKL